LSSAVAAILALRAAPNQALHGDEFIAPGLLKTIVGVLEKEGYV
jgi:hypothetical protein